MAVVSIDLRCPTGPKALLAKLRAEGGHAQVVDGNLMELCCRDCSRTGRQFDPSVVRVLHRFDLAGVLVETAVERRDR